MATSMTAPAALLAALNTAISADAQYDFYSVPAGVVTNNPAIVGTSGHIAVYLIGPGSTLQVTGTLPATTVRGSATSITPVTTGDTTSSIAAASALLNVSAANLNLLNVAGNIQSPTAASIFACDSTHAIVLLVMPSGSISATAVTSSTSSTSPSTSSSSSPPTTPANSSTSWGVYVGVAVVLLAGLGGVMWYMTKRKAANTADAPE